MFAGFRSRWMMPAACAGASASSDLQRDLDRLAGGQRATQQAAGERFALDQLHHQELCPGAIDLRLADVVERADVRMREPGDDTRFPFQPLAAVRVGGELSGQHLDGHLPVEPRVSGPVDLAHPAGSQGPDNLEAPRRVPGAKRRGCPFLFPSIAPWLRNPSARSCAASSDSTCSRMTVSAPASRRTNTARSSAGRSNARWNRSRTRSQSADALMRPGPQLPVEPGTGQGPVALDGHGGDAEHRRRSLRRQARRRSGARRAGLAAGRRARPSSAASSARMSIAAARPAVLVRPA